jgi:hypothetical protein
VTAIQTSLAFLFSDAVSGIGRQLLSEVEHDGVFVKEDAVKVHALLQLSSAACSSMVRHVYGMQNDWLGVGLSVDAIPLATSVNGSRAYRGRSRRDPADLSHRVLGLDIPAAG